MATLSSKGFSLFKGLFTSSQHQKKFLRVIFLMILVLPFSLLLFYWCHTTNSLALTAFGYLTFFNIGSLATSLISIWASKQQPTPKFSFGYHRVNVLAVFSTTILLIMFGINLVKHSMERVFEPPVVSTENMFFALVIGLGVHLAVTCGISNLPLLHASEAASHSWLQRMLSDFGHNISSFSPSLGRVLLKRLNPITLLIMGGAATLALTQILIDLDELYLADVTGALFISALICGTMLPLSIYTAKILLQTAPQHILPLLDKSLREASTLDGVLGLKNEHFWTITFGSYAGSLHVRVRRDANEQEVLTQLTSRLASQLNDLTIQVVKEDWTLTSPLAPSSSSSLFLPPPTNTTPTHPNVPPNPYLPSTANTATTSTANLFASSIPQERHQLEKLGGTQEVPLPLSGTSMDPRSLYPDHGGEARMMPPQAQGQEGHFVGEVSGGGGNLGFVNSGRQEHHDHSHSLPHAHHGYTGATQVI